MSVSVSDTGDGFPNPAGFCAVAVFTSVVPWASGATVATNAQVTTAVTGSGPVVPIPPVPLGSPQGPPPAAVHVQVALATPTGSGSRTVAPITSLGPPFVTVMV